jgi:tRNA(Ile)-lysidine synthase
MPVLLYYVFKMAWNDLTGKDKDFYFVHFHDILGILGTDSGYKEITLPENVIVIRDYQYLTFQKVDVGYREQSLENREMSKELSSIRNFFSFNDCRFSMQRVKSLPEDGYGSGKDKIIIDLDKIVFPVTMRFRKDGDKFMPHGMSGLKKLKDFFIDLKVPNLLRDNVIIFSDTEKIFWVCGYRIDQRVAITEETKNYLVIKIENKNEQRELRVKN